MVSDADFIGIVECEVAGGIVARYKVIESWKGAPAGTNFTLKERPIVLYGPEFPLALCTEQFFVVAYQTDSSHSFTGGRESPASWRDLLPADYATPSFLGRIRFPLREGLDRPLSTYGSPHRNLEEFRKAIDEFLALTPEEREANILRHNTRKYLNWHFFDYFTREVNLDDALKTLRERIDREKSPDEIVMLLLNHQGSDREKWRFALYAILSTGGRVTLQTIKAFPTRHFPLDQSERKRLITTLQNRVDKTRLPPTSTPFSDLVGIRSPTHPARFESALRDWRRHLYGTNHYYRWQALQVVTAVDPMSVSGYLLQWKPGQTVYDHATYGFVLGSYFGWQCPTNQERYLSALVQARDPYIQVASAIYRCFDDEEKGMAALRELTTIRGDAGAWAAITLVRRGDSRAMDRALEVFGAFEWHPTYRGPHALLQEHLRILLSNAAKTSGAPQPAPPGVDDFQNNRQAQADRLDYYRAWWRAFPEKGVVRDPWLPELSRLRIE